MSQIALHHDMEIVGSVRLSERRGMDERPKEDMIKEMLDDAMKSDDDFPVNLDNVWGPLGYSTKGNFTSLVKEKCIQGILNAYVYIHVVYELA
jgi:hypothetical protein